MHQFKGPISLAVGVLAVLLSACGGTAGSGAGEDDAIVVVATTSIWADVVSNIACGQSVSVQTLIPPGGDPHRFEPSLADRRTLEDAALVVANGLGLEEGLDDTLDAVEDTGTPVFRVGEHVQLLDYEADGHDEHDEHDADEHDEHDKHGHDGSDPHVWFDPSRVAAMLPELGDRLVAVAGLDPAAVEDCVVEYGAELASLDAEISGIVAGIDSSRRLLVTNHDSLGYFADRYGFQVVGTVIPAPSGLAETNPAQLEALALTIEEAGVIAVFAETQHSADDVRALADRVGDIEVVTLLTGTLGPASGDSGTYVGFLRSNALLIAEALS